MLDPGDRTAHAPTRDGDPAGRWRRTGWLFALVTVLALMVPAGAHAAGREDRSPVIEVLSGRADTVTGGDALIQVSVPGGPSLSDLTVTAAGADQTDALEVDEKSRTLTGVIEDLPLGESAIEVLTARGDVAATLAVTNHPQEGPVFSGPHQDPFVCETEDAVVPVLDEPLGAPLDENCSIETRVDHHYVNQKGANVPWPEDATDYPEDLKYIETEDGESRPFIVRIETGTVNRGIYRVTVVHDPLTEPEPTPAAPPSAWNGAAMFMFGGGCPGGWYRQGTTTGNVHSSQFSLEQGYVLMSSSLNVAGNNCNDLLSAESAMMVKEKVGERFGALDHTIGFGSSGGSYQALQIADNYPGILDGLLISDTFPEVGFATVNYLTDAKLLKRYFDSTGTEWSGDQRDAVTGFLNYATISQVAADQRTNPRSYCDHLPEEQRYHPETNPEGARCDVFSNVQTVYGTDPETGMPRRPMDNVGIQYGLGALEDGVITVDQFLDLNDSIGGLDGDSNPVPERTVGDPEAIRTAYQTGRMLDGGGGLAEIPIIDQRTFLDEKPAGDIHARYHSLSLRQRLLDANGTSENLVSVMRDSSHPSFSKQVIPAMDQWLRDIDADDGEGSALEKVIANHPAEIQDGCYLRDGSGTFVEQPLDRDPDSVCEQQYPSGSFPREVAGESIAADVAKCQVAEPDREDYSAEFTEEQWQRLLDTFPEGVCDHEQPGVEQQGLIGTWLEYDENGVIVPDDGSEKDEKTGTHE